MITTSKCAERALLLLFAVGVLAGCERDQEPSRFSPTGDYYSKLDASGKRHIVEAEDGSPLAKLRVRDQEIKAYDAEMAPLGTVRWSDEGGIVVTPVSGEKVQLESPDDAAVFELKGSFRLERVKRGWAIYDVDGRRLGYVEETDDGEFALRDDYSSPPRAYARKSEHEVKTPSGRTVVTSRPDFRSAPLLPFALDAGLTALERVALGLWLEKVKP